MPDPVPTEPAPATSAPGTVAADRASPPPHIAADIPLSSRSPRTGASVPDGVGPFRIGAELARGGIGVVYRARQVSIDRDVAVKVLQDRFRGDPGTAARFVAEARITGLLQHPGVPPVFDVGELPDGSPFLAMKLIHGRTLADHLADRPDPSHDRGRFVAAFEQVCQAVGFAHAHRILHRDLKPQNVMVGAFGEVQVMDWGLAKEMRSAEGGGPTPDDGTDDSSIPPSDGATQAGSVLGTPAYMPPEQAAGAVDQIDERSDVFGLGGVLCAILTGQPPYVAAGGDAAREMAAAVRLDPALARLDGCGAEPELVALCRRCLSPAKADRPADAGAVARAVAELRAAANERARRAELDRVRAEGELRAAELRAADERRRRRARIGLAAAALVVVGLLAAGAGWARQVEADRAAEVVRRRAETEVDVGSAVAEAAARLGQARGAADDRDRWARELAAADAALRRAEQAVRAGEPADDTRARVADLRTRWAEGESHLRLADRLDDAVLWLDFVDKSGEVSNNYRVAFADGGFAVLDADPTTVGRAVRGHPLAPLLTAALTSWLGYAADPTVRAKVRAVLEVAADGTAAARLLAAGPAARADLLRAAADPDTLALPPRQIEAVALALAQSRARADAPLVMDVLRPEVLDARAEEGSEDEAARHALDLVLRAVDRHPRDVRLRLVLVFTDWNRMTRRRAELTARHLTAAVALRPGSARLWLAQGFALTRLGEADAAARSFRQALELDPRSAGAHNGLGNLYMVYMPDYKKAADHFRRAIEIQATALLLNNLARALGADRQHAAAVATYREAARLDPTNASVFVNLSGEHVEYREFDEAIPAAKKAIELNPDSAYAHYNLGAALSAKGKVLEGMSYINKAISLDPRFKKPVSKSPAGGVESPAK